MHLQISNNGRVLIPKKIRDALGIKLGSTLSVNLVDDTLQITSIENSLKKVRALLSKCLPDDNVSLVDELLRARREEVAREKKKFDL